jgi:NADH-quinone oxidoreductase subunit E
VARLTEDNLVRAQELIALYPHRRSALIPVLHLVQEQEGYLSPDGIEQVAELCGLTAAEVRGTASFYDMFHLEPIGRYLVAVCTNIACMLDGAYELLGHMEKTLGVHPGATTADGMFTLEDAECLALCGNAPCVTVNWRFFGDMTPARWDQLSEDLKAGRLDDEVPRHGTLCRVRRAAGLQAVGATVHSSGAVVPQNERPAAGQAGKVGPGRSERAQEAGPLDARGHPVQLATERTTPAVASALSPGAGPATDGLVGS